MGLGTEDQAQPGLLIPFHRHNKEKPFCLAWRVMLFPDLCLVKLLWEASLALH